MQQTLFCESFNFCTAIRHNDCHTDNSSGISTHYIARMESGSGLIRALDGSEMKISAGDIFYLPRGLCYHSYWSADKRENLPAKWQSYAFTHFPDPDCKKFVMQIIDATDEMKNILNELKSDMKTSPKSVGLLYLFLGMAVYSMKEGGVSEKEKLYRMACDYIGKNTQFRVRELAKHCGMSESGLYAFFRQYAATTPVKVKQQILAERAEFLLSSTDRTVEDIARELNFSSSAHLRKTLAAVKGKNPSEMRKEWKQI